MMQKIKRDNEVWKKNMKKSLDNEFELKFDSFKEDYKTTLEQKNDLKIKDELIKRDKEIRQNI